MSVKNWIAEGMSECSSRTVLAVVAHSDDETLGIGGTLARHVARGDRVYALSMTDGVGSRLDDGLEAKAAPGRRADAASKAASILGIEWLDGAKFPDNAMDKVALLDIVRFVEAAKERLHPAIIYTHASADLNIDHRRTCEAVLTAFRPQPGEVFHEIRAFEVASATDYGHTAVTGTFAPNLFVDITRTWPQKAAALQAYDMEMRDPPHSRSHEGLETLARHRGGQAGLAMAEAFQIIRKIERQ